MRIGLFTDTYHPSVNGIVFVVDSLKKQLEAAGHEVFVFCPGKPIVARKSVHKYSNDPDNVIRFPSIKGAFYNDYDTSLFFPPYELAKIRQLELDIIHFMTPGQIGLMGVQAAHKLDIPLIAQHCTDMHQYAEHYTDRMLLPGMLMLLSILPFTAKLNGSDIGELLRLYRPRRRGTAWMSDIIERAVTIIYSKCTAVIALSRKSKTQLESWQHKDNYMYDITLLPNGVDPIPKASKSDTQAFRQQWGIHADDEVIGFVGRLGAEKNLDVLIDAFTLLAQKRPHAKLLFVGDFDYREQLEAHARDTPVADRIIFTGIIPRPQLGAAYANMHVFAFPSLTDTQGWAVHEAALSGLPLVLVDRDLSEVMHAGVNGEFADNTAESLSACMHHILDDPERMHAYSRASKRLAKKFTEEVQVTKLIELYEQCMHARIAE